MRTHRVHRAIALAVAATSIFLVTTTAASAATREFRLRAHTASVVAHTYEVTTTTDDTLWSGAPAHKCEDQTNHSKCSLRAAVLLANKDFAADIGLWDVIDVPAGDFKLNPSVGDSLYLDEIGELSIDGAGASKSIIDGKSLDFLQELFYADGAGESMSFNGLEFKGGYESGDAGAIWIPTNDSAVITNCSFVDDYSEFDGGAIYADAGAELTVANSSFAGNGTNYAGGAIYDDSWSGLTLTGDTFTGNLVEATSAESDSGGAVYSVGPLYLDHDSFVSNDAYGDGGAVYADSELNASNDTFNHNHSADYNGGAIYSNQSLVLDNSKLTSNAAGDSGGAIYDNYSSTLNGDTFQSNVADSDGGDIYNDDQVNISNSSLSHSSASGDGGSIFTSTDATLTATNDSFTDESAFGSTETDGGGALYFYQTYGTLNHDTITGSKASDSDAGGGGIFCAYCTLALNADSLTKNTASYAGGAILCYTDCGFSIDNSTISSNTAEWGGGIQAETDASVSIDNSTIDSNNATYYWGGGVSTYSDSTVNISNSTLANNHAKGSEGWGGAVGMYGESSRSYLTLVNNTLYGNQAVYGGGIYSYESDVNVVSSTVAYNTSAGSGYGGGIFLNSSTAETTDSIWSNNTNAQCGGDPVSFSGGYNLDSDSSCNLTSAGDLVNTNASLGSLTMNGGPTATAAPLASSRAVGGGGPACQAADQRGQLVPTGQTCDIGAVFVGKTSTTLTVSSLSLVKGHENSETFHVTVKSDVSGEHPTGSASVMSGTKLLCTATLTKVSSSTYDGSCSLTPSELGTGTHKVTAWYNVSGVLASSASTTKSVKVKA